MRIKEMLIILMIKQILPTGTIRNTHNLENSEENTHADAGTYLHSHKIQTSGK